MSRCPSCDFLVQVEWSACRRCGAPLPLDLREPHGASPRVRALPTRRAPAPTGERLPTLLPPSDTLLPHGGQYVPAPQAPQTSEARADTFLPHETPDRGRLGRAVTPATALDTLVDIGRRVLHLWRPT